MAIAITEDHQALSATVADLAVKRELREANRAMLETDAETLPDAWDEIAGLGWLGIHVPETHGGSGFGIEELVVIVEELGRRCGARAVRTHRDRQCDDRRRRRSGRLGRAPAGTGRRIPHGRHRPRWVGDDRRRDRVGLCRGRARRGLADLLLVAAGDDVVVVDVHDESVRVEVPANLDPSRRSARITLDGTPATVLSGGASVLVDLARILLSAEAVGMAAECTEMAAAYAKERVQFGRPIAMFQAVKHHCANMAAATEMATSATWDAARAAATGGDQLHYAAAVAATLAAPAADLCANLNTQVHGGIAITWEHDAHLYMRRATTLLHFLDADRRRRRPDRPRPTGRHAGQDGRAAPGGGADPRRRARLRRRRSRTSPTTPRRRSWSRPATPCRTGPRRTGVPRARSSSSSSSRSSAPPASSVRRTASRAGTSSR